MRTGPPSALVTAYCLKAPSHYLNQGWFLISKVLWQYPIFDLKCKHRHFAATFERPRSKYGLNTWRSPPEATISMRPPRILTHANKVNSMLDNDLAIPRAKQYNESCSLLQENVVNVSHVNLIRWYRMQNHLRPNVCFQLVPNGAK